jgi:hypothetical protein
MLSSLVEARDAAWAKIMQEPSTERSTVIYLAEHDGTIGVHIELAHSWPDLKELDRNADFD